MYLQVQVAQQREELKGGGEAPVSLIPYGMLQGIIQPVKLIYRIVMGASLYTPIRCPFLVLPVIHSAFPSQYLQSLYKQT